MIIMMISATEEKCRKLWYSTASDMTKAVDQGTYLCNEGTLSGKGVSR
jgi:hypothetical protein